MADELKRLSELVLWEDNYNHGDVMGIARSIRRLGFNRAPGIWQGNEVRAGNHTVMALRLIQVEGTRPKVDKAYPPANVVVGTDGEWMINWVDLNHLSEEEAVAFAIADNQWARSASADPELLAGYLSAMSADLMTAAGFDEEALKALEAAADELQDAMDDIDPGETDPEPIPEQYLVVVECADEAQQVALLERLMGEGLTCRALLS